MAEPINLAGDIHDTHAAAIVNEFLPRGAVFGYVAANLCDAIAGAFRERAAILRRERAAVAEEAATLIAGQRDTSPMIRQLYRDLADEVRSHFKQETSP